jgi:hypothetical protein
LRIRSYGRSVVPTIGAVEIMDDALFLPWCVLSIGNFVWLAGVRFCLYTRMPGWAGHGFGVGSVSESVSVINVLDGGSKTIVGFVNGSSCCGL